MSLHFSANQFEDAYAPQRLNNWQVPKNFTERPRIRHGATRAIADDGGHFTAHHHHGHSSGRKNNLHLRFQSAPLPKSNGLFISGSAVATTKPARNAKVNLGQRTTQPTEASAARNNQKHNATDGSNGHLLIEEDEEEAEEEQSDENQAQESSTVNKPFHLLTTSTLPDNPRKAAIVLAARQKNHRPLPDLMLEARDVLIPRGWNQPEASAVTVETTKAKGPTSCTKRTVLRLQPEGVETGLERRPNVMELAIKWDVNSPPPSAGSTRKKAAKPAMGGRPVEKTLEWLYDPPVVHRPIVRPVAMLKKSSTPAPPTPAPHLPDSGAGSALSSGGSSRHSMASNAGRPCPLTDHHNNQSDPESGYNSPRSADEEQQQHGHGTNKTTGLTDLDETVKALPYRSGTSSAATIPPKNHFLVSTTGFGRKNSNNSDTVMLPEYPLQRRSPEHHQNVVQQPNNKSLSQVQTENHKQTGIQQSMQQHQQQQHHQQSNKPNNTVNEYPPQQYRESHHHHRHHHHHQCDRSDSGIGDLHDQGEDDEYEDEEEDEEEHRRTNQYNRRSGGRKQRSRPCLACQSSPGSSNGGQNAKSRGNQAANQRSEKNNKTVYKLAMKAGTPSNKNHLDLEKVFQRRQSYRAPKPFPLSSHARHIRGTLAPPLSAGAGIEPVVDYPDFKRLDSTYRLSYGVHPHPQRRRPKTLTALLNEKSSRQWKS